jgi:motility quorum-sensing regulator/GCU-specific mRNA interferase toxin
MEKSKAHYSLNAVKAAVADRGKSAFTKTALFNALAMGISADVAMGVILTLSRGMFYKSMTTKLDHTLW